MSHETNKRNRIIEWSIVFFLLILLSLAAGVIRTQAAEDMKIAVASKADGLKVAWSAAPGVDHYYVKYTAVTAQITHSFKAAKNATSYVYEGAVNGTRYDCKVVAYDAKNQVIGYTPKKRSVFLLATSVQSIGENSKGTLTLTWKQNKKAKGYEIWRSTDGGTDYGSEAYKKIGSNETLSFTDEKATIDHQYRYRVYAMDGESRSPAATSKNVVFQHTPDAGNAVLKPTCTTGGVTVYRCKFCKTELSTIYPEKLNHAYGNWVEVSPPTCQEKGVEIRYCTRSGCGASEMRETKTADHEKVEVNPEAVTCTKGAVIHYACRFCGKDMGSEFKEAKGHTVVKDPAVRATATRNGKTEGSHCAVCGMILEPQKMIPMTAKVDAAKLSSVTNRQNGILVKWKKSGNADGYLLFRKIGNGKLKKLAVLSGNKKTAYTDKKAKAGKQYSYQVTAFRKVEGKTILAASSEEKTTFFLPAVEFKRVKSIASDSVTLFWKKAKKCSGYQIRVNASGRTLKTGNAKKSASSVTIRRLNRGTYKIYIRAYRKKGGKIYYGAWCTKPAVFTYPGKAVIGK